LQADSRHKHPPPPSIYLFIVSSSNYDNVYHKINVLKSFLFVYFLLFPQAILNRKNMYASSWKKIKSGNRKKYTENSLSDLCAHSDNE